MEKKKILIFFSYFVSLAPQGFRTDGSPNEQITE